MSRVYKKIIAFLLIPVCLTGCGSGSTSQKHQLKNDKEVIPLVIESEMDFVKEQEDEAKEEKKSQVKEKNNNFDKDITNIVSNHTVNGDLAVYVYDLNTGDSSVVNEHKMQAASLIKLYIAGCVYENYNDVKIYFGSESKINDLMKVMITISDNNAANSLTTALGNGDKAAGMQKVNNYCNNHGYGSTHMGRFLLQSNENDDNYTSVADCGKFLKDIYNNNISGSETIASLMKQQERVSKIPAGIPGGVTVANKTGELTNVENDVAIVYDNTNPFIICVMSENLGNPGSARSAQTSIAGEVYSYITD